MEFRAKSKKVKASSTVGDNEKKQRGLKSTLKQDMIQQELIREHQLVKPFCTQGLFGELSLTNGRSAAAAVAAVAGVGGSGGSEGHARHMSRLMALHVRCGAA